MIKKSFVIVAIIALFNVSGMQVFPSQGEDVVTPIFGMQILPEMISESEYGKLTFTSVSVPIFEEGTVAHSCVLYVENQLKQTSKEPHTIASFKIIDNFCEQMDFLFFKERKHRPQPVIECEQCREFKDFWYSIYVSIRARLFELDKVEDYGLASFFCKLPFLKLYCPLFKYNDEDVPIDILPAAGYYLTTLYEHLDGETSEDCFPGTYHRVLMKKIEDSDMPKKNIVSWAFTEAFADEQAQASMREHPILLFGFFPPEPVLLRVEECLDEAGR
jgi:hypothetical protein